MKIIDRRLGDTKYFEDIERGQVFTDGEGCYWIKFNGLAGGYNAVALDDGEPVHWGDMEEVYLVEVELIIK